MPLVAMTREMGSLGKDVAAGLSERLGKRAVHHEIIDNLANKMRLRKSHVIRFLEGKSGVWERLTTDRTSLSIYTADETFDLITSGRVGVIRGWGAAHLLRQVPHVVCVRVCAPFDLRVKRMMQRLDTDDRSFVEKEIQLSEEAHAAITRRHFGIDWQQAEQYDLVLNTERLRIGGCVEEIVKLVEEPQFRETPQSMQLLSDLALQSRVRAALRHDPRTTAADIGIESSSGRIRLLGILDAVTDARAVAEVAFRVAGVKEVLNELKSAVPSRYKMDG